MRRPDSSAAAEENLTSLQQEVSALELKETDLSQQIGNLISQSVDRITHSRHFVSFSSHDECSSLDFLYTLSEDICLRIQLVCIRSSLKDWRHRSGRLRHTWLRTSCSRTARRLALDRSTWHQHMEAAASI